MWDRPGKCEVRWAGPCRARGRDESHRCDFDAASAASHLRYDGLAPSHVCACGSELTPAGVSFPTPREAAVA